MKQKLIELLELTKDNKQLTKIILDHYYEVEQSTKPFHTEGVLSADLRSYLIKEGVYDEFMNELARHEEKSYSVIYIFSAFDWNTTKSGFDYWKEHSIKFEEYTRNG